MDEWFDRCASLPNWYPKESGEGSPHHRVVDRSFTNAYEFRGALELPDGFRATTIVSDVTLGPPEALMYTPGIGMDWHTDRERPLHGYVHAGTLVLVRYSDDAAGGELHVRRDSVETRETSPEKGGVQETYIPLGEPHRVTALTGGRRMTAKMPVYVRLDRPRPPPGKFD